MSNHLVISSGATSCGAAGHGEVAVERVGVDGGAVPLGDRADHDAGVQDVVVVREVAGRHLVDAGLGQLLPVAPAQFGGGRAGGRRRRRGPSSSPRWPSSVPGPGPGGGSRTRWPVLPRLRTSLSRSSPSRDVSLRSRDGTRARRGDEPGGTRPAWQARRPPGVYADPPTRSPGSPRANGRARAAGRSSDSRARPAVRQDTYWPSLPRPGPGPVRMTAVVPAHRCGAVPDSHRVPSYDASRLADGANQLHRPA